MSDIGPGDYVEYVGPAEIVARRFPRGRSWFACLVTSAPMRRLVRGPAPRTLRVVDGFDTGCTCHGHPTLILQGGETDRWCPDLWRPVYRPKADTFAAFKAPPPLIDASPLVVVPETTGRA